MFIILSTLTGSSYLPILKIIVIIVMYSVHCTLCTEHYRVGVYGADSCLRNIKKPEGNLLLEIVNSGQLTI